MALQHALVLKREAADYLPLPIQPAQSRPMLSRNGLVKALGALWLLDGALQLQPSMFTSYLPKDIMQPVVQGQPGLVAATLQPGVTFATHHVVIVNVTIMLVQLVLGLSLLSGRWVRPALALSVLWSVGVWYGGEGMGMLLTGQASVLTGAPGPVLLYGFLALVAFPRSDGTVVLISRGSLRYVLAGIWILAALLQLQPAWWQAGQIAGAISANKAPGTLNGALLDPMLDRLSGALSGAEAPANMTIISVMALLAVAFIVVRTERLHRVLAASVAVSGVMWVTFQGCGLLLTGGSTDVNLSPLLILLAFAAWTKGAGPYERLYDECGFSLQRLEPGGGVGNAFVQPHSRMPIKDRLCFGDIRFAPGRVVGRQRTVGVAGVGAEPGGDRPCELEHRVLDRVAEVEHFA